METYVILRRAGWRTPDELQEAAARSTAEGDRTPDDIRWIRSYVLSETDGSLGTVCVYQASGPEAIRSHRVDGDEQYVRAERRRCRLSAAHDRTGGQQATAEDAERAEPVRARCNIKRDRLQADLRAG